jgi:hypothetical protein
MFQKIFFPNFLSFFQLHISKNFHKPGPVQQILSQQQFESRCIKLACSSLKETSTRPSYLQVRASLGCAPVMPSGIRQVCA